MLHTVPGKSLWTVHKASPACTDALAEITSAKAKQAVLSLLIAGWLHYVIDAVEKASLLLIQ